ncbi:MAG: hypothetical protein AAF738_02500 [Bacteroidota bacterium]
MRLSFVVLVCSVCFLLSTADAQQSNNILNTFPKFAKLTASSNTTQLFFITRNSVDKKVVGSPYLSDWRDAFLVSNEDEVFSVRARYRVFDDEFQVMLNGKIKAVYPQMVKGIIFKDQAFVPAKFEVNDRLAYSFFELKSEGDLWLLKRHGMSVKSTKDGFLKMNSTTSRLYYLYNDKEKSRTRRAEPLENKQKEVLKALGEYKQELQSYASKEGIGYSKEQDIKKLFDYYNSILE